MPGLSQVLSREVLSPNICTFYVLVYKICFFPQTTKKLKYSCHEYKLFLVIDVKNRPSNGIERNSL